MHERYKKISEDSMKNICDVDNAKTPVEFQKDLVWLVGCFGFNGPLRQYFSLYRAVSQREGEREEKG